MEVTRYNFSSVLKELRDKISTCSFVAMDLELSGLRSSQGYMNSLFDTASKRYEKLRLGMNGIVITQIGLSIFHYKNENTYISSTYTFHLCPQYIGDINQMCTLEASVFSFLETNNFDMNKFAYEGIPYLNKEEKRSVVHFINSNHIENTFSKEEIEKFYCIKSQVVKWMNTSTEENLRFKETSLFLIYVDHKLRTEFPFLDISTEKNEIIIKKNIVDYAVPYKNTLKEDVLNYTLGFSHVVKLLEETKKPLVFHNGLGDIIMFYKQFILPLPTNYCSFKRDINRIFPRIYDSKYIFPKLKKFIKDSVVFDNTSLKNVYTYFHEKNGRFLTFHSPTVKMDDEFNSSPWFHHAGWDAYCTGFCFIKMSHCLACDKIGTDKELTNIERLSAMKPYCNIIFLSRATQPYIHLNDYDPPSNRPPILHVTLLKDQILDIKMLAEIFGRFTSVDVRKYGKKTALVAPVAYNGMRKIMEEFKNNQEYKVTYYKPMKHSPVVRMALWSGVILSTTGAFAVLLYSLRK